MSTITDRVTALLPDGADPTATVEWAAEARTRDETRIGVIATGTGRIIARTHQDAAHTWRINDGDVQALGLIRTVVDMSMGALRDAAGEPVRHITISEAAMGNRPRQRATADAATLEARMLRHHARVADLEEQLRNARAAERDAARALHHEKGVTKYRIAQILGVSQPTAARMVQ